jgi:HEAT repeat protein
VPKRTFIDPEEERWHRAYPRFPGVARCAALLRSPNVRGTWVTIICHELARHAAETFDELVAEFRNPHNDARVRALLVWAIGDAAVPSAVPFLTECLADADESVRGAAAYALEQIGTKDARTALRRARSSGGA